MQELVNVMKAFSEPNRVKIVKLLQHRSKCVEELQSILGIAQPTVSNHLKVLSFARLVACSRKGFWGYYYPGNEGKNREVCELRKAGSTQRLYIDRSTYNLEVEPVVHGEGPWKANLVQMRTQPKSEERQSWATLK